MIYSKDFAVCPWCGHQTGSTVSHLYDGRMPIEAGPWRCSGCQQWFSVLVKAPGDVEITKADSRKRFIPALSLLKRGEGMDAVFFVMKSDRLEGSPGEPQEEIQDSQRYFYEEHSCPTNWLRDCIAVIEGNDTDPHGFLEFVRSVDAPEDFEEHQADWFALFPEMLTEGPMIDGEARFQALPPPPIAPRGKER